jgi:hypothetical protein
MAKLRTEYSHSSLTKKLTILFSIVRALRRDRLIFLLTQSLIRLSPCMTLWWKEADGGAMEDVAKRENPKYAVVPWGEYERRIVEAYGHASINVITVLYRYNTVRNDFVDLKIMIKNTKTETATGSILRTRRRTCESSFNERNRRHIRRYWLRLRPDRCH